MEALGFRFAYPWLLLLLLPVAAWVAWTLLSRPAAVRFSGARTLARLAGPGDAIRARVPLILRTVALVLLVVTVARPQTYNVSREVNTPGVDIMLCLDTSGSMQALDFTLDGERTDRLTAVKKVVSDFIKKREHDRIGLVVFGTHAFTQAPLTLDQGLLLKLVAGMRIGMAGDSTAIGDALAIAGKRIKDIEAKEKVVILLTDGRSNAGDVTPPEAASALASLGIRVYTIGVGGTGPALFPSRGIFGKRLVRQEVDLDEQTLREIADIGNGRYFRATDTERLVEIYDIIDEMEKTEVKVREFFHYNEKYLLFLLPALALLGLELVFRSVLWRCVP
ncbi:MAG: vWA domain-containing protein [Desulfatibacillaceae bacterium]